MLTCDRPLPAKDIGNRTFTWSRPTKSGYAPENVVGNVFPFIVQVTFDGPPAPRNPVPYKTRNT
jgi:hypothetical protein